MSQGQVAIKGGMTFLIIGRTTLVSPPSYEIIRQ